MKKVVSNVIKMSLAIIVLAAGLYYHVTHAIIIGAFSVSCGLIFMAIANDEKKATDIDVTRMRMDTAERLLDSRDEEIKRLQNQIENMIQYSNSLMEEIEELKRWKRLKN